MQIFKQYKLIREAMRSQNVPEICRGSFRESYTLRTQNYMISVDKTEPDYDGEDCNYHMSATNLKNMRQTFYSGDYAYIMSLIIESKRSKGAKTK